ncbi:unnamed protein product [Trifolium pratense]|uniref:Uncharacterized protein n=1 Tax=Trifolium pratense TaxID=57577 RepID=A0ACB0LT43_TRIPR|nr:unnamed protein product [Trifolium pratense]
MATAAQKHLHELLKEDQEPFLLTNYITEKRINLLKRPSPNTTLQLKKQKSPSTTVNLCKNACFFSFQNTPDIKKSPLFEFSSPTKTTFQIPAKTASLLLEAALKIQNNKKPHYKNKSFGVFGSLLKKLTQRNRNKKSESSTIEGNNNVSVKDILRWDSSIGKRDRKCYNEIRVCSCEVGFTCSSCNCNGRHSSSGVWSESNEDKSLDTETSSSGNSCDEVDEFVINKKKQNEDCVCFDHRGFLCESPFRFVLERSVSSSSGHRTPEFSSPADSPSRNQTEDKEVDGVNKFQSAKDEEEKEQCSPVSVLDPPFQDYDDDDDDCHENDDEEDDYDLECSYANVQRTKQQLLDRLRRFEQLAELDPLELEKRMQEENEYEAFFEDDDEDESDAPCEEKALREIVNEILYNSSVHDRWQNQEVLKRLVYDLIKEEENELNCSQDMNNVMKKVCKKMELWKEVESNTIDMMIEEDFTREEIGWKKHNEETKELAREVELSIFSFLVDEFSEELVC